MKYILLILAALLMSCGAMKRTKKVDRVKQSATVERNEARKEKTHTKAQTKQVTKTQEDHSQEGGIKIIRETSYDTLGRKTKVTEIVSGFMRSRGSKSAADSVGGRSETETEKAATINENTSTKSSSVKKDIDTERSGTVLWWWIGAAVFAVAVIWGVAKVFLRR